MSEVEQAIAQAKRDLAVEESRTRERILRAYAAIIERLDAVRVLGRGAVRRG